METKNTSNESLTSRKVFGLTQKINILIYKPQRRRTSNAHFAFFVAFLLFASAQAVALFFLHNLPELLDRSYRERSLQDTENPKCSYAQGPYLHLKVTRFVKEGMFVLIVYSVLLDIIVFYLVVACA